MSHAMVPLRNKQLILSGRSLTGDITLDSSSERKIRSLQGGGEEGEKVILSRGSNLRKRLMNEHVINDYGRFGKEE